MGSWNTRATILAVATLLTVGLVGQSQAAVQTLGAVQILSGAPGSLMEGELDGDETIWGFLESESHLGLQDVNVTTNGSPQVINQLGDLTPGQVSGFDSWMFHFDPLGQPSPLATTTGSVTFDTPILGIIVTDALLDASDAALKNPGTVYPYNVVYRGLELDNQDQVTVSVSGDNRTVSFDFLKAGSMVDQVRVLTAMEEIPEPSTLIIWSLLGALAAAIGWRRRSRAA